MENTDLPPLLALYILTDLTYVLFPVMIVWKLHMDLRRRLGLMALMTLSLFTVVASVLKMFFPLRSSRLGEVDVSYSTCMTAMFGQLEQCTVVIMGCVPPLRGLAKLDLPRSLSNSLSSWRLALRRTRSGDSKQRSWTSGVASGYEDLEMAESKTTGLEKPRSKVQPVITSGAVHAVGKEGDRALLVDNNGVRVTEQFDLSYD